MCAISNEKGMICFVDFASAAFENTIWKQKGHPPEISFGNIKNGQKWCKWQANKSGKKVV